ncbi:MAG: family transcriptional regulator, cyclic receptor protein [Sphingomonadales bacterium]|nr:family transcriptional regulator, cyclic receptor protein [Sphingomonadales bacterium]
MAADDKAKSLPEQDVCAFLRETFGCSDEIAGYIFVRGTVRAFAPHATIVRQGEKAAAAYLLTQGRAHALLYSLEGQMVLLCEYRPGDLFGALGELDPAPEEAEIVAVEAARSFILRSGELVALAEAYGAIGLALSRLLLRQLRRATSRIYERAAVSAVGRVHAELLRLARASPDLAIRPPPVLSELAVRVSTTRETASRAVSALERRGIVRRDAHSLAVVAPQRLEELII